MKSIFEMTPEERRAVRDANPPEVTSVMETSMYFNWGWKGCGFGQLQLILSDDRTKIECHNEHMSRDSVRKILHAYADFLATHVILVDNPEDVPPPLTTEEN